MAAKKTTKKATDKVETSKKIIWASYAIGAILTIITVVGNFRGFDMSVVMSLALASYAEITASNAFYFSKAKKENALKISLSTIKSVPPEKVDDVVKLIGALVGII